MHAPLTEPERQQLRQLQKQRRDEAGYVKVTMLLMLDAGWAAGQIARALSLDDGTIYRYEQPGDWTMLTSAQLVSADMPPYSGLAGADGWHALLDFGADRPAAPDGLDSHKLATALPCEANDAVQTTFLTATLPLAAACGRSRASRGLFCRRDLPQPTIRAAPGLGPGKATPDPRSAGTSG